MSGFQPKHLPRLSGRCDAAPGVLRALRQGLDERAVAASAAAVRQADCLIVGGSSLVVHPAAGLLDHFRGDCLLIINREPTPYDSRADFVFHGDIAEVLTELSTV